MDLTRNKKVLCPMEGKNGKTFWFRVGNAYINADGSTNVWLNAYPTNGKLQIRDLDEQDLSPRRDHRDDGASESLPVDPKLPF